MTRDRSGDGPAARGGIRRGLRNTLGSRADREDARRTFGLTGAGPPPAVEGLPPEAVDALRRGRKIEAIKIVRQQTGLGLAEAKDLVERATGRAARDRRAGGGLNRPAGREDHGLLRLAVIVALVAIVAALALAI